MNLTDTRPELLDDPSLTANERVVLRCRLASELIQAGQYETARQALSDLWRGVGKRPQVEGLKPQTAAEVILQCGTLSSWFGKSRHISGAQESAKDLLSEALRIFKAHDQHARASEAQYELGMCYFWLGAYDEARMILDEALKGIGDEDIELRAKILIRHTIVEIWTGRYHDALNILEEAQAFFERCGDALKGRWHGQKGLVLRRLATAEGRTDYADRAIMEFTAAIFHYEQAQHERYCAINLNNLAMLLYRLARHDEAHENLERATGLLTRLGDDGLLAQVNETRARVLVAEHRYDEASRVITNVVQTFEKAGEQTLLADALVIQGVALARLGEHERSLPVLRYAINLAENSGAFTNAGLAALALVEEHGTVRLSEYELYSAYRRADELLRETEDVEDIRRLRMCARVVMRRLSGAKLSDKDFTLAKAVQDLEARFIDQALELEEGSVTRAAKRLGVSHQTLAYLLETKHKTLHGKRTPATPRRRSIIKKQ